MLQRRRVGIAIRARPVSIGEIIDDYFTKEDSYDEEDEESATSVESSSDDKEMTLLSEMDDKQQDDQIEKTEKRQKIDYRWQWRHTVSYWISIGFIFGALLFVVGIMADSYEEKLNEIDHYTLGSIALLVAGIANWVAGYCSYHEVINEANHYNPNKRKLTNPRRKKIWCIYTGKQSFCINCQIIVNSAYYVL